MEGEFWGGGGEGGWEGGKGGGSRRRADRVWDGEGEGDEWCDARGWGFGWGVFGPDVEVGGGVGGG